jgi:hypothetical protein
MAKYQSGEEYVTHALQGCGTVQFVPGQLKYEPSAQFLHYFSLLSFSLFGNLGG